MLTIISPSKTQDFEANPSTELHSNPALLEESEVLMEELRGKSEQQIAELMTLSEKLSALNHERFQNFHTPFTPENAKQALLAFKGDVYTGFELDTYTEEDFKFAQDHLRILSGLYGLLRPLDLIQPYRLEMKIKLKNPRGKDLYQFWDDKITHLLNEQQSTDTPVLVNLASNEYFKAIKKKQLKARIITPVFKEKKGDSYKVVALFAKKARGMMANYIIKNRLDSPEALQGFSEDGYAFHKGLSSEDEWVFTRG